MSEYEIPSYVYDSMPLDWDEAAADALYLHMVETECPALEVYEEIGEGESFYYCISCGVELDV